MAIRLERVRIHWEPDPTSEYPEADVVSYPTGPDGDRRLERLTSAGLNGIDGATGAYRREVEREQLEDLRDHLDVFGVEVDGEDWDRVCHA